MKSRLGSSTSNRKVSQCVKKRNKSFSFVQNFIYNLTDVIQHEVTGPGSRSLLMALALCFITKERRSAKINPCAKFP